MVCSICFKFIADLCCSFLNLNAHCRDSGNTIGRVLDEFVCCECDVCVCARFVQTYMNEINLWDYKIFLILQFICNNCYNNMVEWFGFGADCLCGGFCCCSFSCCLSFAGRLILLKRVFRSGGRPEEADCAQLSRKSPVCIDPLCRDSCRPIWEKCGQRERERDVGYWWHLYRRYTYE